jgi:hypothetical protein
VNRARRVMAPSRISTVTHIIFALLFYFASSLRRLRQLRYASVQHVQRTPQVTERTSPK